MKKIVSILLALCLAVAISGCSQNYEKALEGSWYLQGNSEPAFTFYSDGTCTTGGANGTGSWAIVNDNQLKITEPLSYGGDFMVLTIESLKDGCLTLNVEDNQIILYDKP